MATKFIVNGKPATTDAPIATPLLWVIREDLKLTGTKFGCGTGLCGACMVHIDGKRAFSCQTQVSEIAGKSVTTIEGLSRIQAIRCRKPGSSSACRNVATVSPVRS
jgi:isoquinoline 1-oxidoreductase alpha subunit